MYSFVRIHVYGLWVEVAIGGAGPDWAGPTVGRVGPKLARFFRAKILTAQPALKIGPVGPNSLFKAKKKKIRAGRAGPGHTGLGHTRPGQIWPDFFRAKNLMAQPGPNFGLTRLAHRAGSILPPLVVGCKKPNPRMNSCMDSNIKYGNYEFCMGLCVFGPW